MQNIVCILEVSNTCWFAGIKTVLPDTELECNSACQMMQVYLLPGLSSSHRASSFISFSCDGEMFIFNSFKTKSVKIVDVALT